MFFCFNSCLSRARGRLSSAFQICVFYVWVKTISWAATHPAKASRKIKRIFIGLIGYLSTSCLFNSVAFVGRMFRLVIHSETAIRQGNWNLFEPSSFKLVNCYGSTENGVMFAIKITHTQKCPVIDWSEADGFIGCNFFKQQLSLKGQKTI